MSVDFFLKDTKYINSSTTLSHINQWTNMIPYVSLHKQEEEIDLSTTISSKKMFRYARFLKSGRGFQVSYYSSGSFIRVRVATPSTMDDWKMAFEFMSNLASSLNIDIKCESGTIYTSESIHEFDCKKDIMLGLKSIMALLDREDSDPYVTIHSLEFPFHINKQILNIITKSRNPVLKFSQMLTKHQFINIDGYYSRLLIGTDMSGQPLASYTLPMETPCIIPWSVELYANDYPDLEDNKIDQFNLIIVNPNGDMPGVVLVGEYTKVRDLIPKQKYRFIDANNVLVSPLNQKDVEDMKERMNYQ